MRNRTVSMLGLLVVMALFGSGCGEDSEDGGVLIPAAIGGASDDGGSGDDDDWCVRGAAFVDETVAWLQSASDGEEAPSRAALVDALDGITSQFDSIKSGAPDEIKADLELSLDGMGLFRCARGG